MSTAPGGVCGSFCAVESGAYDEIDWAWAAVERHDASRSAAARRMGPPAGWAVQRERGSLLRPGDVCLARPCAHEHEHRRACEHLRLDAERRERGPCPAL